MWIHHSLRVILSRTCHSSPGKYKRLEYSAHEEIRDKQSAKKDDPVVLQVHQVDTCQKSSGGLHCSLVLADPIARGHEIDDMLEVCQKE